MGIQIGLCGKLLVAFDARKFFVGMNLHIVLFEQFERFEIFSLGAFSYMIFALNHGTVENSRLPLTKFIIQGKTKLSEYN